MKQKKKKKTALKAVSEEKPSGKKNANLALGEAPDEGTACPFVAAWVGLVGRVCSILTLTLRRREAAELIVSNAARLCRLRNLII